MLSRLGCGMIDTGRYPQVELVSFKILRLWNMDNKCPTLNTTHNYINMINLFHITHKFNFFMHSKVPFIYLLV